MGKGNAMHVFMTLRVTVSTEDRIYSSTAKHAVREINVTLPVNVASALDLNKAADSLIADTIADVEIKVAEALVESETEE
ncbi:MAG: hypothetical protein GYA36_16250 [Veillonellaceae bacterium]|nr:hypothetical protein [Veillonellaceae bacterium]